MLDKHPLHKTLGRASAILLGSRYSVTGLCAAIVLSMDYETKRKYNENPERLRLPSSL